MNYLYFLLLSTLFYFSSYRMIDNSYFHGMYAVIALILVTIILFKVKKFRYNISLLILASLFVFTGVISALLNSDTDIIINALVFFGLFLSTTVVSNSFFKDSVGKIAVLTLVVSHVPIIIMPLITEGIPSYPYAGIFENTNSFGLVVVTIFAVFLAVFLSKLEKTLFYVEKPSKMSLLLYLALTIFSFLLVVFSASRTSFLAGIISTLIGISFIFLFALRNKKIVNLLFKTVLGFPLILLMYFITSKFIPIKFYIEEIILSKFDRKSSNFLDGRSSVWMETIKDAKLFGNGTSYFNDQIGMGAHNTFIYVLGIYGWVPLLMFILFFLVALYFCIRFIFSEHDYKYLPLIIFSTFIALSIGENVFYRTTMVALFILVGLAANNKRVVIT